MDRVNSQLKECLVEFQGSFESVLSMSLRRCFWSHQFKQVQKFYNYDNDNESVFRINSLSR